MCVCVCGGGGGGGTLQTWGIARIFQGGVTLCQNEGAHQIVMLPLVVKKKVAHKRGGEGVTGTPGPP